MGPLVPELFNQEFNYVIAIVIGFFFGFVLEQAGFSNSRRLTGLFYGYDFVVLRVFFTAGVTAMLGILFMGNMGWIDISAIYVHPTFLNSAIVGGLIMGLGFILGGYCPGTSIAGAAIGKIDAMVYIVGAAIGIFFFGTIYDSVFSLYTANNWGNFTMFDALGISPGVFAFILTTVALLAFVVTKRIEDKVNKVQSDTSQSFIANKENRYVIIGMVFVFSSALMIFQSSNPQSVIAKAEITKENPPNIQEISSIELAYRIIDEDYSIQIFDMRDAKEIQKFGFPASIKLSFNQLMTKVGNRLLKSVDKNIVFVDNDGVQAREAAFAAIETMGGNKVYYLKGGMSAFDKEFKYNPPPDTVGYKDYSIIGQYEFKKTAIARIKELTHEYEDKNKPVETKAAKPAGGC